MKTLGFVALAAFLTFAVAPGCSRSTDDGDTYEAPDEDLGSQKDDDAVVDPDKDATTTPEDKKTTPTGTQVKDLQQKQEGLNCPDGSDFINLDEGVKLDGVIVTAPLHSATDQLDSFFVQDDGGGAYSGIRIMVAKGSAPDLDPAVGDVLDIVGDLKEFYCLTEFDMISAAVLTSGPAPAPFIVPAADVAATSANAEQYEGVLVQILNVKVKEADNYGGFVSVEGVTVDDSIFADMEVADAGCVYASITGVIDYNYGEYKLLPRTAADLVLDDAVECEVVQPTLNTIEEIQTDAESTTNCDDGGISTVKSVALEDVIVASPRYVVSDGKLHGFYGFQGDGGANNGALFLTNFDEGLEFSIGDVLSVSGEWTEFYCLTEIKIAKAEKTDTIDGTTPISDVTFADLAAGAGEKWEGTIVRLPACKVAEAKNQYGEVMMEDTTTGDQAMVKMEFDFEFDPAVGATFTEIVGGVTFNFGNYKVVPRFLEDIKE